MYYKMINQLYPEETTAPVGTIFWFEEDNINRNSDGIKSTVTIDFEKRRSQLTLDIGRCYSIHNFIELPLSGAEEAFNAL